MRVLFLMWFVLISCVCVGQQTSQTKRLATAPITLEFGNMQSKKPEVLEIAKNLKDRTDQDSREYVASYSLMMRTLKLAGVSNFSKSEMDIIQAVSQPGEPAVEQYFAEKATAVRLADKKSQEIEKWSQNVQLQRQQKELLELEAKQAREAQEREEQRQAEINRIEERKADAMERQARALQGIAVRY